MGISVGQLAIVLIIVLVLFGSKKLRTLGSDFGAALRELRKGLIDEETPKEP